VCVAFRAGWIFGFKENDFQKMKRASKINILRNMAPKIVKQILVDFLGVGLQYKNIA
jgi:hypothetical protein